MRSMSANSSSFSRAGFTLTEVLIIAPFVILTIAGFVALIITITGDVMRTKGSSDAVYNTQAALDRIEEDARMTTEFRATSYTTQAPQGITNTSFDTGGATISAVAAGTPVKLIARTLTTNGNPIQETKSLIYKDPSNSNCSTKSTLPYTADIVYYLKPDLTNGTQSLWRRLVHGDPTLAGPNTAGYPCPSTVFQRRSCSPDIIDNTGVCQSEDVELVKNVSNLSVYYIDNTGNGLAGPSASAAAIQVTIETTDNVAGRTSVNSGTLYSKPGNSPVDDL